MFVDASGWISIIVENDRYHKTGRKHFERLVSTKASLYTTDYILDEVITRLRYDVSHEKASEFLAVIQNALQSNLLILKRIDEELWIQAEAIFMRYSDVKLSFTLHFVCFVKPAILR